MNAAIVNPVNAPAPTWQSSRDSERTYQAAQGVPTPQTFLAKQWPRNADQDTTQQLLLAETKPSSQAADSQVNSGALCS
jgi:hypothetical protein